MKLLLDQNISRRILPALAETWPGSSQAGLLGLDCASDLEIWEYARDQGFENNRRDDVLVSRTKTTVTNMSASLPTWQTRRSAQYSHVRFHVANTTNTLEV